MVDGCRKPVASGTWKLSGQRILENYITFHGREKKKATGMKIGFTAIYFRDNLQD